MLDAVGKTAADVMPFSLPIKEAGEKGRDAPSTDWGEMPQLRLPDSLLASARDFVAKTSAADPLCWGQLPEVARV
jgi:hypothetical protein